MIQLINHNKINFIFYQEKQSNLEMNDNHETFFFTQKQKRRIHEQDYAMKVVSHTKVDKETI